MISTPVKEIVARLLHQYADNIASNNSNLTEEQAANILSLIVHIEMSKEEICDYLNLSRSRFDDLVREGKLPRGKKVKHKNNLVWYKDEVMFAAEVNLK